MVNQRIWWSGWILFGFLLTGTAGAQIVAGPKFVVSEKKAPEEAVMKGYVRVFSHTAITIEERDHPNALRTFSLPAGLVEKYRERHLEYGDRIKVRYRLQGGQAVEIHAHWRKGS